MAIENLKFEIYFRFSRIQTNKIFTSYGGYLLNTKLTKTYILTNFNLYTIIVENFIAIRQG